MLVNKIVGAEGKVELPELGAVVGQFQKWTVSKERKEDGTATGRLKFRGELKYINKSLFNDPDYERQVIITLQRDRRARTKKQYRVDLMDSGKVSLQGRVLLMEGVQLYALTD